MFEVRVILKQLTEPLPSDVTLCSHHFHFWELHWAVPGGRKKKGKGRGRGKKKKIFLVGSGLRIVIQFVNVKTCNGYVCFFSFPVCIFLNVLHKVVALHTHVDWCLCAHTQCSVRPDGIYSTGRSLLCSPIMGMCAPFNNLLNYFFCVQFKFTSVKYIYQQLEL